MMSERRGPMQNLHLIQAACRPEIRPVLTQCKTTNGTAESETVKMKSLKVKYENCRTDTDMSQGSLMQPGWCSCLMIGHCRLKCLGLNSTVRDGAKVSGSPPEALCSYQDRRRKEGVGFRCL